MKAARTALASAGRAARQAAAAASASGGSSSAAATAAASAGGEHERDGYSMKMVLVVRGDLGMGKGKIAAQACHGALEAYKQAARTAKKEVAAWEMMGQPKIVVKAANEEELRSVAAAASAAGLVAALVRDAGHTQIAAGSVTVAALGPAPAAALDPITRHLKLL